MYNFKRQNISNTMKKADGEAVISAIDGLILILYALFLTESFLGTTTFRILWPQHFHEMLTGSMIILIIIKSAVTKPEPFADWFVTAILSACFIAARISSGYAALENVILLLLALKKIPMEKILKVFLVTISSLLLITITASQIGLIENLVYGTSAGRVRNSFGVCYPTDFAAYFFWLSLAWVSIRNKKIRLIEIAGIAAAGFGVLKFCIARTSALCLFAIAFMSLVLKVYQWKIEHPSDMRFARIVREKKRWLPKTAIFAYICKYIRFFPTLAIPGCAAFVIFVSYFYRPEIGWMNKLNTLLSTRLSLGKRAFEIYDVKWLGQYIAMRGNGGSTVSGRVGEYFFLDSSWVSVLFCYGILVFFCVLLMYWFCACRAVRRKESFAVLVFVMIAVNAISEHHMIEICYNPFLFALLSESLTGTAGIQKKEETHQRKLLLVLIVLAIYGVSSLALFYSAGREVQKGIHKMWVPREIPSEELSTTAGYLQGFYTPGDVTGIELHFAPSETGEYAPMILRVYDWARGELIGESKISPEQIGADGIAQVIFPNFVLKEGKVYGFEVNTVLEGSIPTRLWMGQTQQGYGLNVLYQGAEEPGTSLVYNLLYDYEDPRFVLWMFLTVVFLVLLQHLFGGKGHWSKLPGR